MTNSEIITKNEHIHMTKSQYSNINIEFLPFPVQRMMANPIQEDYEEIARFLVGYFAYNLGWSFKKVEQVMMSFYTFREPLMVAEEFKKLISDTYGEYNNKYYPYTNLVVKYGRIDFGSPEKGKVKIPIMLIENMADISDNALKMYIIMIVNSRNNNSLAWDKDKLATAADVSIRTIDRNYEILTRLGLVELIKSGNDKVNDKFRIINKNNSMEGVTIVNLGTLRKMLLDDRIKKGSLKVFIILNYLIKYRLLGSKCDDYQKEIGEFFRRTVSRVSELTTDLCKHGYINKNTYYILRYCEKNGKMKKMKRCTYQIID